MSPFHGAHTISYSSLIETMHLSYTFSRYGELFMKIRQLRSTPSACVTPVGRARVQISKIFGVRKVDCGSVRQCHSLSLLWWAIQKIETNKWIWMNEMSVANLNCLSGWLNNNKETTFRVIIIFYQNNASKVNTEAREWTQTLSIARSKKQLSSQSNKPAKYKTQVTCIVRQLE